MWPRTKIPWRHQTLNWQMRVHMSASRLIAYGHQCSIPYLIPIRRNLVWSYFRSSSSALTERLTIALPRLCYNKNSHQGSICQTSNYKQSTMGRHSQTWSRKKPPMSYQTRPALRDVIPIHSLTSCRATANALWCRLISFCPSPIKVVFAPWIEPLFIFVEAGSGFDN